MAEFSPDRLLRIACSLIAFKNPSAKRRLERAGIKAGAMRSLDARELGRAGFSAEEIGLIHGDSLSLAEKEARRLEKIHCRIIFQEDGEFPPLLRQIYDPPDFIYYSGRPEWLASEKIAVVGSRRGSAYGQRALKRLLPDLCRAGLVIVSGMAYGIDSMAHSLALAAGGGTIGVNGGGLLHLYPPGNMGLIRKILESGAVISEFPLDAVPRPYLFPVRNRIISGLCRTVLIIEATMKSGSLITAKLGLEQNREVMAVPGDIDSSLSSGTHYLIQQGAKLVHSSQDILDEYGIRLRRPAVPSPELSAKEKKILDLLGDVEVKDMDSLVEALNLSPAEVISVLMGLVLKNLVIEESGFYRRTAYG